MIKLTEDQLYLIESIARNIIDISQDKTISDKERQKQFDEMFHQVDLILLEDDDYSKYVKNNEFDEVDKKILILTFLHYYWLLLNRSTVNRYLTLIDNDVSNAISLFFNSKMFLENKIIVKQSGDNIFDATVSASPELEELFVGVTLKSVRQKLEYSDVPLSKVKLSTKQKDEINKALTLMHDDLIRKYKLNGLVNYGRGNIILLYGPPGTGKTMVAKAIANKLDLPYLLIDYSSILSKYYSESLQNLAALLSRYENRDDVIIIFDEADSLFQKRTASEGDVSIENNRLTNYLLTWIEKYKGYIVLTTNKFAILDDAVERRITFKIAMDIPDAKIRREIWKEFLKGFKGKYDYKELSEYILTGGDIKNIILDYIRELEVNKKRPSNKLLLELVKDYVNLKGAARRSHKLAL